MSLWAPLDAELALWKAAGERPVFWWRDDDAQAPTEALETMLGLAGKHQVPLHMAVIPKGLSPELAPRLTGCPMVRVMQHGFAHVNHEPKGTPASEIGVSRPLQAQAADLAQGMALLQAAGLPRLMPALVPPWNRIADTTRAALPGMGYRMLSAYGGRGSDAPVAGLTQVDGHLDPIRWKHGRQFRGADAMVRMTTEALSARRIGTQRGPIGFLTHHLQTDAGTWAFTDAWLARLSGATWAGLEDLI